MNFLPALLKKTGLVVLGLALAVFLLEVALRFLGLAFLESRQVAGTDFARASHYRILCLGESTTADMSFRGKESYPAQLQRILNERSDTVEFTVINRGWPAARTDQIISKLRDNLDEHEPDMVVAMMGINDRGAINPVLPVSGGLRIWKLAKMFYYTLFWSEPAGGLVAARSQEVHDEQRGTPSRPESAGAKKFPTLTREKAAKYMLAGRHAEAEELLLSLLDTDVVVQQVRTNGQLAVLNWQRGQDDAAKRYHDSFEAWHHEYDNPKTTSSYATMQTVLAERDVFLLAVQYPGRSIEPLTRLVRTGSKVAIVDNQEIFLDAVKARPVGEIYRDLFAGIFGHLTAYGNTLLAESVAEAILALVERRDVSGAASAGANHATDGGQ